MFTHSRSGSPNSVDGCAGARILLFAKSHRQLDSSFAPRQLPKLAQSRVSSSLSLTRVKNDDDADVVDEGLHPLTLLTGCSTSGNVTEGVDEMVEAWPPWCFQKVGR